MTDFDFDELDRAVSGVLDDTPVKNDTPVATPVPSAPSTQVVAPAARRSAGRFMDIVHPSSDMRSQNAQPRPAAASVSSSVHSEPPAVEKQTVPSDAAPSQDTLGAVFEESFEDTWQKPLESPFLPDAKVEKRPLGGEAPQVPDVAILELLEAPDEPRLEAHTMPDPIDFALGGAPSQESPQNSSTQVAPEAPEATAPSPVAEDVSHDEQSYGGGTFQAVASEPELESQPEPEPEPEQTPAPVAPETTSEPIGPASITQQYEEQPSSTPEPGAIYDTEAYHQPLHATPKKKSGWLVVLWIFLVLVLGGGAGAAFYFYVLPML